MSRTLMITNNRITYSSELVAEECYKCHIVFAMPADMQRRCLESGGDFYCPNGHGQRYITTEIDKLKRQLEQAKRQRDELFESYDEVRMDLAQEKRHHASTKGQLTKTKKRVAAGVCPCCNRHFVNLERHMSGQHPTFGKSDE